MTDAQPATEAPAASAPRRPRSNPRRIVVQRVERLSPRMRRITFAGPELTSFAWSGPAAHIKLIPPDPGRHDVAVPEPDGPRPTTTRTYTPRRFEPGAATLDVDFVLHGEGPASSWAARAAEGDQLVLMGPGRGYDVDPEAAWYVLICDDAALPAIETILDALPPTMPVTVFAEVAAADEARPLPGPLATDVRWCVRNDPHDAGGALHRALAAFTWPTGAGRVYVGCESNAMRALRTAILAASGLDKTRVVARGYWRLGAVNHPDRDYADD